MNDELLEQPARDGTYRFLGFRYIPGDDLSDGVFEVRVYDGEKAVMIHAFNRRSLSCAPITFPYLSKEPLRIEMPDGLTARWSKEGGLDLYG